MVIILHFNNSHGGAAILSAPKYSVEYEFLLLLEAISISAVNVFIMISGYFLSLKKERNITKLLFLFVQLVIVNILYYVFHSLTTQSFSLHGLMLAIIPSDYFVWLYAGCYVIGLWMNLIIDSINKKQFKLLLIILLVLFSIWPTIIDAYINISGNDLIGITPIANSGSGAGYTIVQFIMDYMFGAYLARYPIHNNKRNILLIIICTTAILVMAHVSFSFAIEYCNLFVVLNSYFILSIFSTISIRKSKLIDRASTLTFLMYLLHTKLYFIWKNNTILTGYNGTVLGIVRSLVLIVEMYIITLFLAIIFQVAFNYIFSRISKRHSIYLSIDGFKW